MIREVCYKITENCPCNCKFCDSKDKYEKIFKKKIMKIEEWINITDKLVKRGLEVVVLSGGEPLLEPNITFELIRYLKRKKRICCFKYISEYYLKTKNYYNN